MKLIILVAVALVAAVVADVPEPVKIVRSELNQNPDGSYTFTFESEDGTVRQETGELREVLDENNKLQKVIVVRGSYTYINPDGKPESINYSADEGGFSAEGESIPKKPEQVSRK